MAAGSCPMCGESTADRDRFCSTCGVRLDDALIIDPERDTSTETIGTSSPVRRFAPLLVPIGVAAVLTLGAVVLFGGDESEPGATDESSSPTTTPVDDPVPDATPEATSTVAASPTPPPTAVPQPSVIPVADVASLPPTDSTHIAVTRGRQVGFLDLRSGQWTMSDFERTQPGTGPWPFAQGIVASTGQEVLYAPVDGPSTVLRDGWVAGATNDAVWIHDPSSSPRENTLVAVDAEGRVVDEFLTLPYMWVSSVLSTGDLVVQGGGRIFARSSTGDVRVLAEGETFGLSRDRAVLHHCDEAMDCGFAVVDLATGTSVDLDLDLGFGDHARLVGESELLVYGDSGVSLYRIEDGELGLERELTFPEADRLQLDSPLTDIDSSGLRAGLERGSLVVRSPAGETPLIEVDLDFFDAFGETGVVFITVADS